MPPRLSKKKKLPPPSRIRGVRWVALLLFIGSVALFGATRGRWQGARRHQGSAESTARGDGLGLFGRFRAWAWGEEPPLGNGDGHGDGHGDGEGGALHAGARGANERDPVGGAPGAGGVGYVAGGHPSSTAEGSVGGEDPSSGAGGGGAAGGAGGAAGGAGSGSQNPSGNGLPDAARDPHSDSAAPTLVSVIFDPPEVKDGMASTARFEVTDDLSGVQNVNGLVSSPAGALVGFNALRVAEGNVWAAIVEIPKDAEAGVWWVSVLSLTDKAANTSTVSYTTGSAPAGAHLRVVSSTSDTTPPVARAITLVKPAIADGDTNVVMIDVSDDRSGVAGVYGTFESPKKMGLLGFSAQAAGEGSPWVGQLPVPRDAACGEWRLRELHLVDKANNRADLDPSNSVVASARFTVYSSSGRCDSNAPTIRSITVSPRTVSNETDTPIAILIDITDDSSGVAQVSGSLVGPTPASGGRAPLIPFSASASSSAPDAPWSASAVVPRLSSKGTWHVGYLQVADLARNIRYYNDPSDPALAGSAFDVR